MKRSIQYVLGLTVVAASIQAGLAAQIAPVPEIDGGTIVSGIGLLSGAALILRARFSR